MTRCEFLCERVSANVETPLRETQQNKSIWTACFSAHENTLLNENPNETRNDSGQRQTKGVLRKKKQRERKISEIEKMQCQHAMRFICEAEYSNNKDKTVLKA